MKSDSTKRINLFSLKILIFGQTVSKIPNIPCKGIRSLSLTQPFFDKSAEIVYGSSGDHYLSIGIEKSRFWALLAI